MRQLQSRYVDAVGTEEETRVRRIEELRDEKMLRHLSFCKWMVFLLFGNVAASYAATTLPEVPPAVLAQLQNMSPQEQVALARQYGLKLPKQSISMIPYDEQLGVPGVPLELDERAAKMMRQQEAQEFFYQEVLDRTQPEGTQNEAGEPRRFGLELFDREISTFAPVDDMPAPDSYRVGPGDSINVYMYGNEEADLALSVNRDGLLVLPRLGPISVVGLTFEQVKELIDAKVASQLVGTTAVVSLGKLRSIGVVLAGEVVSPGSYSVSGLSTVLQVLYQAGGIAEIGSLRNIQVKRSGKTVAAFDAYDLLLRGDASGDIRLASGDTVFVPTVERLVTIDGEVKRPAVYEVSETDTLSDLIKMAGGVSSAGYSKAVSIQRRSTQTSSMIRLQVDLNDEADLKTTFEDGDKLSIASIKEEFANQILLRGAVARPGGYAWFEGQRVSDLISSYDEDLLVEADLSSALLVRRTGEGLEIETLALDLREVILNPGSALDLELRPLDEVFVFALPYLDANYQQLVDASFESGEASEAEETVSSVTPDQEKFESRRDLIKEVVFRLEAQAETPTQRSVVMISGDVRLPGKYPLLANRSLDALIALSGGFESSAFLSSAEITRLSFSEDGNAEMTSIQISLRGGSQKDEDFLLEPLDQVHIKRIPNWSYGDSVTLTGSVMFPGQYPIVPGEKLSSVLSRAGGLADNAFPEGAVLSKVEARKREREQLQRLVLEIQRASLVQSQTREQAGAANAGGTQDELEILDELLKKGATGRVVIDLPAILAGDFDADVQLGPGDSLFIPQFDNTITVTGEVRQPGTFRYDSSRGLEDYIDMAAGVSVRGDRKETYVIRANGSVDRVRVGVSLLSFTPVAEKQLSPGDAIVIPVNENYQPVLAKYKEISTVVFQSIASIYPLFRL